MFSPPEQIVEREFVFLFNHLKSLTCLKKIASRPLSFSRALFKRLGTASVAGEAYLQESPQFLSRVPVKLFNRWKNLPQYSFCGHPLIYLQRLAAVKLLRGTCTTPATVHRSPEGMQMVTSHTTGRLTLSEHDKMCAVEKHVWLKSVLVFVQSQYTFTIEWANQNEKQDASDHLTVLDQS